MTRRFRFAAAVFLVAAVMSLIACSGEKMDPAYKDVRDRLVSLCSVRLPELSGVTVSDSSEFDWDNGAASIVIPSGSSVFMKIVSEFRKQDIGVASTDDVSAKNIRWDMSKTISGRLHEGAIEVTFDNADADNSLIRISVLFKPRYTVEISRTIGGAIEMSFAGSVMENNKAQGFSGDRVSISATANEGCVFSGWFEDETLISSAADYTYEIAQKDIVMKAKFEQTAMTESYVKARSEFKNVTGIELPNVLGTVVSEFKGYDENTAMSYILLIPNCENRQEIYDALKTFFDAFDGLPGWAKQKDDVEDSNNIITEWMSGVGTLVRLLQNSSDSSVCVNATAEFIDPTPTDFTAARNAFEAVNGIEIGDYQGAVIPETARFRKDGTDTKFSFTGNDFTVDSPYAEVKGVISTALGVVAQEQQSGQVLISQWISGNLEYSLEWYSESKRIVITVSSQNS